MTSPPLATYTIPMKTANITDKEVMTLQSPVVPSYGLQINPLLCQQKRNLRFNKNKASREINIKPACIKEDSQIAIKEFVRIRKYARNYISKVRAELIRGYGFTERKANKIMRKGRLRTMIWLFPQEQMHYCIEDTTRELLEICGCISVSNSARSDKEC